MHGENCVTINCNAYNDGANGIVMRGKNGIGINHKSYNNAERGIIIYQNQGGILYGCNSYNNTQENYSIYGGSGTESSFVIIANCSGSGVGSGFDDYEISSTTGKVEYFGHNHANSTSYCNDCSNAEFADLLNGHNITGDPKFVSITEGSEDFDLEYDSPLQRTGINNTTIGAGTRANPGGGSQSIGGGIVR